MTIGDGWRVEVMRDPQRVIDVFVIQRQAGSKREILAPNGNVYTVNPNEVVPHDVFWPIPYEALQPIMDALWKQGIRPKDRRHDEEAKLLRESLDRERKLLDEILPRALRSKAK